MKKLISFIMCITLLSCVAMTVACEPTAAEADVVFAADGAVSRAFDGVGVEWGVYEDTNKLAVGS
jgi:hypothetical protein